MIDPESVLLTPAALRRKRAQLAHELLQLMAQSAMEAPPATHL